MEEEFYRICTAVRINDVEVTTFAESIDVPNGAEITGVGHVPPRGFTAVIGQDTTHDTATRMGVPFCRHVTP